MRIILFLSLMLPLSLIAQKADSIPTCDKIKKIELVCNDSRARPSNVVYLNVINSDTTFNITICRDLFFVLSKDMDTLQTISEKVSNLLLWRYTLNVPDSLNYLIQYKLTKANYVKKIRKLDTQKILHRYFNKNYIYNGRVKEEIYYAIIVVFWERNIVTFFDDESGVLIIDFATMNYVPGKYYESGERRLN